MIGTRPDPVVRDDVWIEVQPNAESNEAVYNAQCEEERIFARNRDKDENLRRFQRDVKKRVTRAAQIHRRFITENQTVKMEQECEVLYRSASAAERSTPKKNRCTFNINPITIDCSGKIKAANLSSTSHLNRTPVKCLDALLDARSQQLEEQTLEARRKLAERSIIVPNKNNSCDEIKGSSTATLPSGLWGIGSTRDKCAARIYGFHINRKSNETNNDCDETVDNVLPAMQDIKLASVQQTTHAGISSYQKPRELEEAYMDDGGFYLHHSSHELASVPPTENIKQKRTIGWSIENVVATNHADQHCAGVVARSATTASINGGRLQLGDKCRSTLVASGLENGVPPIVRPAAVALDQKRASERARWLSRRVFADAERERTREECRTREHKQRVARLRAEKERIRSEIELKSRQQIDAVSVANEQLKSQVKKEERKAKKKTEREYRKQQKNERFVAALRSQLHERVLHNKVDLPPLCMCATSFWETHPLSCANNCLFYHNNEAYSKALEAVLQVMERNIVPFHKDALQRSAVSLPLVEDDDDEHASARTFTSYS